MFSQMSLGLEEAQGAVAAMLTQIRNHPEKYAQEAAMAVVNESGKLVAFAKMDGPAQHVGDIAIRKAWTAAICRRDTAEMAEFVKVRGYGIEEFLPGGTTVKGGVAIVDPDEDIVPVEDFSDAEWSGKGFGRVSAIGGIGVSRAGPWQLDLEIAKVGLKYIQDKLWAKK